MAQDKDRAESDERTGPHIELTDKARSRAFQRARACHLVPARSGSMAAQASSPTADDCGACATPSRWRRIVVPKACLPLTASIFLRIAAEAAWDEMEAGAALS